MAVEPDGAAFPRLRAGTFIEADITRTIKKRLKNFPAFGRGLSLRPSSRTPPPAVARISPPSGGDFH